MLRPSNFSTLSENETLSRDRNGANFLIDGSRIFPPLQKLFRKFHLQTDNNSIVTTLPSIAERAPNARRPFVKPEKSSFNGFSSDGSPFESVELSSCSYTYSPSVVAAGFKQKYWPSVGATTAVAAATFSTCNIVRSSCFQQHLFLLSWHSVVKGS